MAPTVRLLVLPGQEVETQDPPSMANDGQAVPAGRLLRRPPILTVGAARSGVTGLTAAVWASTGSDPSAGAAAGSRAATKHQPSGSCRWSCSFVQCSRLVACFWRDRTVRYADASVSPSASVAGRLPYSSMSGTMASSFGLVQTPLSASRQAALQSSSTPADDLRQDYREFQELLVLCSSLGGAINSAAVRTPES